MPFAGIDPEGEKRDLKSLPGGWVQLKTMSWRQKLQRQDMMMRFQVQMTRKGDAAADYSGDTLKVQDFDLRCCVLDHNLEDKDGNKYELPRDISKIHPRIGSEIDDLIAEMNGLGGEDDELPNSSSKPDDTSSPRTQED